MATGSTKTPTEQKIEIDLMGWLRRRWRHVALGLILGVGVALLYQYSVDPVYESRIEILIGQRNSELTTSGTVSNANASGDSIQDDQLATHIKLFTSRKIIGDAIENAGLTELQSLSDAVATQGNPVDVIQKHLEVERGGNGAARNAMVIAASYRDPDPHDAATILTAVFESYRNYVESHSEDSSGEAAELIEEAGEKHERELVEADRAYREFVASVPVLLDGEKVRDIHKERLAKLEEELNEIRTKLATARSRRDVISTYLKQRGDQISTLDQLALLSEDEVERLNKFLDMSRGEVQSEAFQAEQPIRQEIAKAQYNRLLDLLQKARTLSEEYGPGHPLVAATRQEIEVIEQFIEATAPERAIKKPERMNPQQMLETYTLLLRNDIAELEIRERSLIEDSEEELQLAKEVESDFLRGSSLKARLARAQARYDEVSRRLQELNLAGSYAGFSTELLSNAEFAKNPAWPVLPIVMLGGVFFGLVFGCMTGLAAELIDTSFRDSTDLEKVLNAPAIAHVPRFDVAKIGREADPDSEVSAAIPSFHAPRSIESEIYRVARTSLIIRSRDEDRSVFMMTSPHPGDGKSTTISNLAVSLAQTGKRVLLIDADMRRPVIAKMFGLKSNPGLSDVLLEYVDVADAAQQSEMPNLDILTHGSQTSEPAELLESTDFLKLLTRCRQQYDYVLIDAPPLLAVADPSIIAPHVDAVVLTIRVRSNCRRPIERCSQLLHELDVTPTALVVNSMEKSEGKSFGYSNNQSYEAYGYVGYYNEYLVTGDAESPRPRRRRTAKPAASRTMKSA